jgi:arginyl-tRNA synthetase
MDLQGLLLQKSISAITSLYGVTLGAAEITFQETRKEFEGDITLVVFPITRFSKLSPEATANAIGDALVKDCEWVVSYNVVKGFLNLVISDTYWSAEFVEAVANANFGQSPAKNERVMVEYSSPNTNKPLHLGHIRNIILGYSLSEILKTAGYDVMKVNLINDRGIHICKSMLAWQLFGNGETPSSSGLKGDHLVGKYYVAFDKAYKEEVANLMASGLTEDQAKKEAPLMKQAQEMLLKWEQKDAATIALWTEMNTWVYEGFNATYDLLGVDFDRYYYESNTYLLGKDIIEEGLNNKVFFQKEDGSVWIDLTADGLDQKLVLRSDGTSVYITQDLGTAQLKYSDYNMDRSIYVVGNEQDYHFKVLFLILEKLGKSWAKGLYHLSYGMVDLPSGKMKSREGTVVDADDLIAEMIQSAKEQSEGLGKTLELSDEERKNLFHTIGMGALKYYLLKVDPKKRLLFNPNESIDLQGHTGPFIQYSYARIQSILRKAPASNVTWDAGIALNANEKECIIQLLKFPAEIEKAAQEYSPASLANYLYELAKVFNKFYHDDAILKLEDEVRQQFRLALSAKIAGVLKDGMRCLGINVPEKM